MVPDMRIGLSGSPLLPREAFEALDNQPGGEEGAPVVWAGVCTYRVARSLAMHSQ